MNRISDHFEKLRFAKQKALVTFITAGDPDLKTTEALLDLLPINGADIIELGIPFSDPTADGPVIQKASERALESHTTLEKILKLVQKKRSSIQIPILLMGYYNPILAYGLEKFAQAAHQAGVDGLIVVDLPPEESEELHHQLQKYSIDLIYLLTPTSDSDRIQKIKKRASGFIYYVSMTGTTGGQMKSATTIAKHLKVIRQSIDLPICIGFGIKTPEDIKKLSPLAEGVVVGSALVSTIETHGKAGMLKISTQVQELKQAL